MQTPDWRDAGTVEALSRSPLTEIKIDRTWIALSFADGKFGSISNVCNHAGGPLGAGRLVGEYVVCPWHNWKFHRCQGHGEPGFEKDQVPSYAMKMAETLLGSKITRDRLARGGRKTHKCSESADSEKYG